MARLGGLTRRTLIVGALPAWCAACGDTPLAGVPAVLKPALLGGGDLKLTRADIDRIPYASLAVRLGRGDQNLTILGGVEGAQLDWISATHEVIATRYGRVIKTVGMPQNLKTTNFLSSDPLALRKMAPDAAYTCIRTIDIEPSDRYGVTVTSRFSYLGREDVTILGHRYVTEAWRETCDAKELNWSFVNRYWRDPESGLAWKSVQHPTPDLPAMELLVTRRAPEV
jgi:hypothetical protein